MTSKNNTQDSVTVAVTMQWLQQFTQFLRWMQKSANGCCWPS